MTTMSMAEMFERAIKDLRMSFCRDCTEFDRQRTGKGCAECYVLEYTDFLVDSLRKVPDNAALSRGIPEGDMSGYLEASGGVVIDESVFETFQDTLGLERESIEELIKQIQKNHPDITSVSVPSQTRKTDITYACGHTVRGVFIAGDNDLELQRRLREEKTDVCFICRSMEEEK